MKTSEQKKKADYLLLHTVVGKYLERCVNDSACAPRYLQIEKIDEVVEPFYQLKTLIQRAEWLRDEEYFTDLMEFAANNGISEEELAWATEMFALQKQEVFQKMKEHMENRPA